jgi:hypothetical protein
LESGVDFDKKAVCFYSVVSVFLGWFRGTICTRTCQLGAFKIMTMNETTYKTEQEFPAGQGFRHQNHCREVGDYESRGTTSFYRRFGTGKDHGASGR